MGRNTVTAIFVLVLGVGSIVLHEPVGSCEEIGAMVDQINTLSQEKTRLTAEKSTLLQQESGLKQEDIDLKARVRKLRERKLEFKMDAGDLQNDIDQYNRECGGSHTRSVYESLRPKCEPWGARIDTKNTKLDKTANELSVEEGRIGQGQQELSKKTLKLTADIKANDAQLSQVGSKLESLQSNAIRAAIADPGRRKKAAQTCSKAFSNEAAACCNSVVFDGVNPQRCGAELIFLGFKNGGVFGTTKAGTEIRRN